MGNRFRNKCETLGNQSQNPEQLNQPIKVHCLCNQQFDNSFPYNDLPPPAPPNGREDLWDLQFCRWWGWNWVRRREVEASLVGCSDEPKQTKGCFSKCLTSKKTKPKEFPRQQKCVQSEQKCSSHGPEPSKEWRPPQNYEQMNVQSSCMKPKKVQQARPLPTKRQFKEMCKCLLGKGQTSCGMANLYNTPSTSMVAIERLSQGVTDQIVMPVDQWPKCCSQKYKKKTRRERIFEDQCEAQSWSKVPEDQELETTGSEEIQSEPLCSQKNFSSTEESIEYLTVRVQHIKSDMGCPCRKHNSPTFEEPVPKEQKPEKLKAKREKVEEKRQKVEEKRNLQTQTNGPCPQDNKETQTCTEAKTYRPPEQDFPCGVEKLFKMGKKHKTVCICICCCGTCNPVKPDQANCRKHSDETKNCSCKSRRHSLKGDDPIKSLKGDVKKSLSKSLGFNKDDPDTYPLIVPPSNMKMLSKFGTPSKNYPWMQNVGSDATTTTLNNWETYQSPASGKTYEFATFDFDSRENLTLPELIDITEDLSYLKKLENTSTKTDHESRLLLDAVCDAILYEHEEKSLEFLNKCQLKKDVTGALRRDYRDLEILCDLQREFHSKSDVQTEQSKLYFNTVEVDVDGMINRIVQNICADPDKAPTASSWEPFKADSGTGKKESPFTFKATDTNVFTKTGLLASNRYKKPIKRGAPNCAKGENRSKKIKHEEGGKVKNEEKRASDRIGTIFTKIEDIVKQSKVKSAEIQQVLKFMPPKLDLADGFSERVLETHCLTQSCSMQDLQSGKITEMDANGFKRNYKMSSDSFKRCACPSSGGKNSTQKPVKKSYEIFADKFDYSLNEYTKSCSGIASEIIFEEENGNGGEENDSCGEENANCEEENDGETVCKKNEDARTVSLDKISKLSIQSFVVCDERSTAVQKPFNGGVKTEKKIIKKKKVGSNGSLIPVRRQSNSGENLRKTL